MLEVVNTNPRAKFLYEKLGFQVKKKTYFGFLTYNSGFSSVEYMFKEIWLSEFFIIVIVDVIGFIAIDFQNIRNYILTFNYITLSLWLY